jgi:hypothetical protein
MPGRRLALFVAAALVVALLAPAPVAAYVGPGPGMEMATQFYSLLALAGLALAAVLLWPVSALVRGVRGAAGRAEGPAQDLSGRRFF